jgi:hypothetical protein
MVAPTRSLDIQRVALIEFAATLLGQAFITRHDRQNFTVHEINGGRYHVVEQDGRLECVTCGETLCAQDRHCALILLYVIAVEGGPRPA